MAKKITKQKRVVIKGTDLSQKVQTPSNSGRLSKQTEKSFRGSDKLKSKVVKKVVDKDGTTTTEAVKVGNVTLKSNSYQSNNEWKRRLKIKRNG